MRRRKFIALVVVRWHTPPRRAHATGITNAADRRADRLEDALVHGEGP